jgi:hypothetical protein
MRMTTKAGARGAAAVALACTICCALPAPALAAPPAKDDGIAILAALDSIATRSLWPGFDPGGIPVAIGSKEITYLYRHPAPPAEFSPVKDHDDLWSAPGLYDSVRADTSVPIEGVSTATLLLGPKANASARESAGTLVHEMFHVYATAAHMEWVPNEIDRFAYPAADTTAMARRGLETVALRHALAATGAEDRDAWTARFLEIRHGRQEAMPAAASRYENRLELFEGLADYVRYRALGRNPGTALLPAGDFAPESVRERAYATGSAMAFLLDRLDPGWIARVDSGHVATLAAALDSAVAPRSPAPAAFAPGEEARTLAGGAAAAAGVTGRMAERRATFMARPGWRVSFITESTQPIWVSKFDPMNIAAVGGREVLHARWIKFSSSSFSMEVHGAPCLTDGAGEDPLLGGVRSITLTGLAEKPEIVKGDTASFIKGEFFQARLPKDGFWMEENGDTLKVYLKKTPPRTGGRRKG